MEAPGVSRKGGGSPPPGAIGDATAAVSSPATARLCPYSVIKAELQAPGSRPTRAKPVVTPKTTTSTTTTTTTTTGGGGGDGGSEEDDVILTPLSVRFYRSDWRRELFFWLLALATGGLSLLLCKWYPGLYAKLRYSEVAEHELSAVVVVAVSLDGHHSVCPVMLLDEASLTWMPVSKAKARSKLAPDSIRAFTWRYERFWYDPASMTWVRRAFDARRSYGSLHRMGTARLMEGTWDAGGHSARVRLATYGPNQTDIAVPPYPMMVLEEALKPFFAFQAFSMGVWFAQKYLAYLYSILAMTTYSILANAWAEWRNLTALQALAKSEGVVDRVVLTSPQDGAYFRVEQVPTSSLLPGDIIRLHGNLVLPCDAILLSGHAILSEAMLTGESAPVMKAALPHGARDVEETTLRPDSDRDRKFILYSGTKVLQAKCGPPPTRLKPQQPLSQASYVWEAVSPPSSTTTPQTPGSTHQPPPALAMVYKTGFSTARGQLVRAILFPPPPKFDFEQQGYKFIWVLLTFLVLGAIVQIIVYRLHHEKALQTLLDLCNLVTIAVPPALPLSLSIGLQVSYNRLKEKGIFCSHTRSVAAAGRVNCLCFDKTGTLTEDGLTLHATQVVEGGGLSPSSSSSSLSLGPAIQEPETMYTTALTASGGRAAEEEGAAIAERPEVLMSLVMAACHSVSLLEEEVGAGREQVDVELGGIGLQMMHKGTAQSSRGSEDHFLHHHQHQQQHHPSAGAKALVGDSLEVALLLRSGWRFCPRPHNTTTSSSQAGAFDPVSIWLHPHLPPGVDTILLPPLPVSSLPTARALAIVRRLDFDTDIRRMGVVIRMLPPPSSHQSSPSPLILLVKGAPESVRDICQRSSLPTNLSTELHRHTSSGFRVLACAARSLSPEQLNDSRVDLERDMSFVGVLSMENRLKAETRGHLALYRSAAFRLIMITGDNPATAAAVGRMAGGFLAQSPGPSPPPLLLDLPHPPTTTSSGYLALTDLSDPDSSRPLSLRAYLDRCFGGASSSSASPVVVTEGLKDEEEEAMVVGERRPEAGGGEVWRHDVVVTGRAFEALHALHHAHDHDRRGGSWTPLEVMLGKANVWARMSPQHKQDLVRALQDIGLVVCMTGDGANDSGALKAGDIGISIAAVAATATTQAEGDDGQQPQKRARANSATAAASASSAEEAAVLATPSIAAPFATGIHHIGAVGTVLAEGRCALTTSVTMFKYMFLYGLIQFTGVLILYVLLLELSDKQYLWADMGVVLGLVMLVPTMKPREVVQRGRPEPNLVSATILRSVVGQTVLVIAFQVLQQVMLSRQPWYQRSTYDKSQFDMNHIPATIEASSKFVFSNFQYLFCCLAFCQTYGLFRRPVYRTPLLAAYFALQGVLACIFCFADIPGLSRAFKLVALPPAYKAAIFFLALANGAAVMLYERFCVPHVSDDEEPVATTTARGQDVDSVSLAELEAADRDCCSPIDCQPTLLPKIRSGPPTYHRIRLAWLRAERGGF